MKPVFPARRADEFSAMVDAPTTTVLHDTGSRHADLLPLVGLVTSLRSTPHPEARPEFVADLRGRLLLAAETALAPDTAQQVEARMRPAPRRTSRERRLAVAVGGFALVSASASMSVAAQTALPGDTLYPLKRAIESVHEGVARGADDKGTTMLDNASGRLDEVDELSRTGGEDASVIAETLRDFAAQAVEASSVLLDDFEQTGRLSSIEELRSFTADSLAVLERLEAVVPVGARESLAAAASVLGRIDEQARDLCPTCSDLPAVEATVRAADVGPIFDRALDGVAAPVAPVRQQPDPVRKPPKQKPPVDEPGPAAAPEQQPDTQPPAQPDLPSDPDAGGPPPGSDDGPLGDVVTGLGNGDALGDLLTGGTEVVDDLLETGLGGNGLGGLGTAGGPE